MLVWVKVIYYIYIFGLLIYRESAFFHCVCVLDEIYRQTVFLLPKAEMKKTENLIQIIVSHGVISCYSILFSYQVPACCFFLGVFCFGLVIIKKC